MKYQFGFIGCGNMGGALVKAVACSYATNSIALCDTDTAKASALAKQIGAVCVDLNTLVTECEYIVLAIKPQGFEELFAKISPLLQTRTERYVLISIAAGISICKVQELAGKDTVPVIRLMPNTPVSVGEGMILYATNSAVTSAELQCVISAMSSAGKVDAISEDKIDVAGALSGCGPAFVYLFAEALADGAVECGLARDKANLYAAQTLAGAAKLLLESGKHPGELKDAVCSPGGTTIAGVHALETGGLRAAAIDAVVAAYQKTLLMKK